MKKDTIYREDVLEEMAMAECGCSYSICVRDNCSCSYITRIKRLPSAETIRGEWIYKTNDESVCEEWECSKCGNWNFVKTDFCPHCGADMREREKNIMDLYAYTQIEKYEKEINDILEHIPQDRILHIDTKIKDGKVSIVAEWQGELVRCKDCRFFKCEECRYYIAHGLRRKPNDFCSNGKPKDGEDE